MAEDAFKDYVLDQLAELDGVSARVRARLVEWAQAALASRPPQANRAKRAHAAGG